MNAHVQLVAGLLERSGSVLLVASRYPNHPEPLWNLPGGRTRAGELLDAALRREFLEETGLRAEVGNVAYVSESYDGATSTHFLNVVFFVRADGEPRVGGTDAHVVEAAWVPYADVGDIVRVRVVREPLLAYLSGNQQRYFGFAEAGITIEFADPA